ncbi:hypothetical protein [Corynebacterium uterequi]|uniref:ABC-2 family transporter protein n=1 Tax=Corynebacterium uterequi TaxID=1072256 RepID=A0A0G3HJ51_9CORY|nr:hypothetical protein [Corynebacterium uterequi]AKK11983.1 ABC-2 family transporter protein [Corynebacterium uterequi]
MNYLTLPFVKVLLKKKEVVIGLSFSLYPLVLLFGGLFGSNFMQLSAPDNSLSCFEFINAVLFTQYQMTLPLIVFFYAVCTIFGDEIRSGQMYLYKDLNRGTILRGKLSAIFLIQILYVALTMLTATITYYIVVVKESYASGKFIPDGQEFFEHDLISLLGTVGTFIICLIVVAAISLRSNNGVSMLCGLVYAMFSFIAPYLDWLSWVFPIGYARVYEKIGFTTALLLMTLVFVVSYLLIYFLAKQRFDRVQY